MVYWVHNRYIPLTLVWPFLSLFPWPSFKVESEMIWTCRGILPSSYSLSHPYLYLDNHKYLESRRIIKCTVDDICEVEKKVGTGTGYTARWKNFNWWTTMKNYQVGTRYCTVLPACSFYPSCLLSPRPPSSINCLWYNHWTTSVIALVACTMKANFCTR